MKNRVIITVLLLVAILAVGCSNKQQDTTAEPEVCNITEALDNVLTVEVYSDGECTELLTTSDNYKELALIIQDNDSKAHIIDGGWSVEMNNSIDYAKYSADENCKVYILNFSKPLCLKYSDYTASDEYVIGMFIVPDKKYIGVIYKMDSASPVGYATLANLEENVFDSICSTQ